MSAGIITRPGLPAETIMNFHTYRCPICERRFACEHARATHLLYTKQHPNIVEELMRLQFRLAEVEAASGSEQAAIASPETEARQSRKEPDMGEKNGNAKENPFARLVTQRMVSAKKYNRLAINCVHYDHTPEQAQKVVDEWFKMAHAIKAAFENAKKDRKGRDTFTL